MKNKFIVKKIHESKTTESQKGTTTSYSFSLDAVGESKEKIIFKTEDKNRFSMDDIVEITITESQSNL